MADNYKRLNDSAEQINSKLGRDPGQDADITRLAGRVGNLETGVADVKKNVVYRKTVKTI